MNIYIFSAVIFCLSLFLIYMLLYAYKILRYPDYGKARKRLKSISSVELEEKPLDIIRQKVLSHIPLLNRILLRIQLAQRLDRLLQQANVKHPLGVFVLFGIVLALTVFLCSLIMTKGYGISVLAAVFAGGTPYYYLLLKKNKRIAKFQRQFPDALEFIARSLKAGHAITNGVKLAGDEFEDPIGTEFDKIIDEVNFGISFSDAMKNMANRMDCPEVKYFGIITQKKAIFSKLWK
ncbi:hypothetical protein D1AOALGA4SA_9798 [Olavius algarvensis Delta 1 endosymbiont]|nr:hypothetical protein D1AOALGA4SA_9798 [Olavius algarvensis Delta 1 endosymbiont]